MRHLFAVLIVSVPVLAISCGLILSSNDVNRYPLESRLFFHIGPSPASTPETTLYVWVNQARSLPCPKLDADFSVSLISRKIVIDVDGIISSRFPCSGIYPPMAAWPFPELLPGRYTLTLKIKYPNNLMVGDIYTVDIGNARGPIVSAIAADSSEYSIRHPLG